MSKIALLPFPYKHIGRIRKILGVLVKYGFDDFIDNTHLTRFIPRRKFFRKAKPAQEATIPPNRFARIRMVLEELGPTFIKMGQILSSRHDLLPKGLIAELSKLHDAVPPDPDLILNEKILQELGEEKKARFVKIEEKAMASASIAQVHKAQLTDGSQVIFKILRPNIKEVVQSDVEIMRYIFHLLLRRYPFMQLYKPLELLKFFERTIRQEMNFNNEASNIERFRVNFRSQTTCYIPKIYREFSNAKILCLEFVEGIKISEKELLQAKGYDLNELAKAGTQLYYHQVFENGFFHADPHPGNLLITNDQKLCFLDFGIMGTILPDDQELLTDFIIHFLRNDIKRLIYTIEKLGGKVDSDKHRMFEYDIFDLVQEAKHSSIRELSIEMIIQKLRGILFEYKLGLPADFYHLMRAMILLEGVGQKIKPDYNMFEELKPYTSRLIWKKYHPKHVLDDSLDMFLEFKEFALDLPRDLSVILTKLKEGELKVEFEHHGLNDFYKSLHMITNRIALAIITASILVGSALIVLSKTPPILFNIPVIGIVGFLTSVVLGIWIIISILRKNKL